MTPDDMKIRAVTTEQIFIIFSEMKEKLWIEFTRAASFLVLYFLDTVKIRYRRKILIDFIIRSTLAKVNELIVASSYLSLTPKK